MESVTIVRAEEGDVVGIRHVAMVSWQATYAQIFSTEFIEQFLTRNYSSEQLTHSVQNERYPMWVAKEAQDIVGFCQVGPHEDEFMLFRIYLLPSRWGQGIGKQLLAQAEDWLKRQGTTSYSCYVHAQNEVGKAFYAKQGFVHDQTLDVDGEWCMRKQL
ncbi:MAG: GNAT family N-acetyltransferase [Caldilineaceae bacterium]